MQEICYKTTNSSASIQENRHSLRTHSAPMGKRYFKLTLTGTVNEFTELSELYQNNDT